MILQSIGKENTVIPTRRDTMHITLQIDVPINANDLSGGTSKIYVELKKIVDYLNYHLNNLNRDNLSADFNAEINSIYKKIEVLTSEIEFLKGGE